MRRDPTLTDWTLSCPGSLLKTTPPPPDTHGYPGGGGVVFSKDPGQLGSGSVSVIGKMFFNKLDWKRFLRKALVSEMNSS